MVDRRRAVEGPPPACKPGEEVVTTGSLILEQMYEDRLMAEGGLLVSRPGAGEARSLPPRQRRHHARRIDPDSRRRCSPAPRDGRGSVRASRLRGSHGPARPTGDRRDAAPDRPPDRAGPADRADFDGSSGSRRDFRSGLRVADLRWQRSVRACGMERAVPAGRMPADGRRSRIQEGSGNGNAADADRVGDAGASARKRLAPLAGRRLRLARPDGPRPARRPRRSIPACRRCPGERGCRSGRRPARGTRRWGSARRGEGARGPTCRAAGSWAAAPASRSQGHPDLDHDAGGRPGTDRAADADHGAPARSRSARRRPAFYGTLDIPSTEDDGPPDGLTLEQAIDVTLERSLDLRQKFYRDPHGAGRHPPGEPAGQPGLLPGRSAPAVSSGASSTAAGPAARSSSTPTSPTRSTSRTSGRPARWWPPVPRRSSRRSTRMPSASGSTTSTTPIVDGPGRPPDGAIRAEERRGAGRTSRTRPSSSSRRAGLAGRARSGARTSSAPPGSAWSMPRPPIARPSSTWDRS